MTRPEVENTIARLAGCVREKQVSCGGCAGCSIALDDLEALHQHDEAQAAEVERLAHERDHHADVCGYRAETRDALAEVERLRAALVAAAEHHEEQADLWNSDNEFGDDETGEYHAERARVLRAAAERKS